MAGKLWEKLFGSKQKKTEEAKQETTAPAAPYLPLEQDGETYNLYEMPYGFVIKGDLDLNFKDLTELPDLSGVIVKGNFSCDYNYLTTLKGAPREVGGDFSCVNNKLVSLEGAPEIVGGHFCCNFNKLRTLEGAPRDVGESFHCEENLLKSLEHAPEYVGGEFSCKDNPPLDSLAGVSLLNEGETIKCDASLAESYGFKRGRYTSVEFLAEKLYESPRYIEEVGNISKIEILRRKIADGKALSQNEKRMAEQEKRRAGYAAFKKKMTKEREE